MEENRDLDEKAEKERRKLRRKRIEEQKEETKKGYSAKGKREAVLGSD